MPTGYTAPIYEGEKDFTFEKFAMRCARNFGALAHLREKSKEEAIDLEKDFQPNSFYKDMLEVAEKDYQDFLDNPPTEEQLNKEFDEYVQMEQARFLEREQKIEAIRKRYEDMIKKVLAWQPPTPEHQSLKDFMLNQLWDSIEFDCSLYAPDVNDREGYFKDAMSPDRFLRRISHYREMWEKEVRRSEECKKYVKDLMDSLNIK